MTYEPAWRAVVKDALGNVLTPHTNAPHADPFQIATISGVAGYKPYMYRPQGRRGGIDPLEKNTDVGQVVFELLDKRTNGDDNLQRWVTAFTGDSLGRLQELGCTVEIDISRNSTRTDWERWFTGPIEDVSLIGRGRMSITVRDMAEKLEQDVFVGVPHASAPYAVPSSMMPLGFIEEFGSFQVEQKLRGTVKAWTLAGAGSGFRVDIDLGRAAKMSNLVTKSLYELVFLNWIEPVSSKVRVWVKRLDTNAIGQFWLADSFWPSEVGLLGPDKIGYYQDGAGRVRAQSFGIKEMAGGMAIPPDGTSVEVYLRHAGKPSERLPIFINEVNAAQFLLDLCLGYFGRLKDDGSPLHSLTVVQSSFDALIADSRLDGFRFVITKERKLSDVLIEICKQSDLSFRLDENGHVELLDLRAPTSVAGIQTIGNTDLYSNKGTPGWNATKSEAITRAFATWYVDNQEKRDEISEDRYPDVAPTLWRETQNEYGVVDFGNPALGDEELRIDAWGYRATEGEVRGLQQRGVQIQRKLDTMLVGLRSPFGHGASYISLICRPTAAVTSCKEGDLRIIDVDEIPDPATNIRGGTRLGRCVEIGDEATHIGLVFLDLGPDTVAVAPTLGIPAQVVGQERHAVQQPVTLNAAGEAVELSYCITETSITVRPVEDAEGWTAVSLIEASATKIIDLLSSGRRVWLRARTIPAVEDTAKLPSGYVFPTPAYIDTQALPAITSPLVAEITQSTGLASWVPGSESLDVEVLLALGAAPASWGESDRIGRVGAGGRQFRLRGLDGPTVQHTVGLRHVDGRGGVGPVATYTFSTTSTPPVAPRPAGIAAAIVDTWEFDPVVPI